MCFWLSVFNVIVLITFLGIWKAIWNCLLYNIYVSVWHAKKLEWPVLSKIKWQKRVSLPNTSVRRIGLRGVMSVDLRRSLLLQSFDGADTSYVEKNRRFTHSKQNFYGQLHDASGRFGGSTVLQGLSEGYNKPMRYLITGSLYSRRQNILAVYLQVGDTAFWRSTNRPTGNETRST